jgi:hypothetical protein
MDLLNPEDWAVIMDGDTMFLKPDCRAPDGD